MAKANIELNLKVDVSGMKSACEKAAIALKEFGKAVDELQNSEIKIRETKPKKWWQFWKRS
jgi:hypothetical protein